MVSDQPFANLNADVGPLGGADRLADRLVTWAAESRADEDIRRRGLERSLRRQLQDGATLAGIALDLAEQLAPVIVHTRAGRQYRGTIGVVATEFVVVTADAGQDVIIRLRALGSLRPGPGLGQMDGDRRVALNTSFDEALRLVAAERPRVIAVVGSADPVIGTMTATGVDIVEVCADGDGGRTIYVSLAGIDELVVDGRV